ncbi:MAG TPA: hypothetical protein VGX92_03185 [Pyrinomonadaceae bacterium]|jgi:hypothetical protein|nr:hypothetical protein [Pyrinomonadaceae bacterium]
MRRIFLLIVATLQLLCAVPRAQTPSCLPKRIEDCPDAGCGGWDKQLNLKKNLRSDPKEREPEPRSLEQIKELAYPGQWFSGKDRAELEALGEGKAVKVTAYLVGVKYGEATFANCKLADRASVNDLLILVSEDALVKRSLGQREPSSVTAEITARVRLQRPIIVNRKPQGTNWTKEKLDAWINRSPIKARLVRITGLLLLDTEHIYNPLTRYTDWEIHPVLEIEVCPKTSKCTAEGEWKKLNEIEITVSAPARPVTENKSRIRVKQP